MPVFFPPWLAPDGSCRDLVGKPETSVYGSVVMPILFAASALSSNRRFSSRSTQAGVARLVLLGAATCLLALAASPSYAGPAAGPSPAEAAQGSPAAKPAIKRPAPLTSAQKAKRRKAQQRAGTLIRSIRSAKPGTERYRFVDQLIDLGDAVWPNVEAAIPSFLKLNEGEAVTVDVLLGFMDLSYAAVERRVHTLSPRAARRVVKFVLRLDADKRQVRVLQRLVPSRDAELLLMVLPALLPHDRGAVMKRLIELVDDKRPALSSWAIDTLAANRHGPAMVTLVKLLGIEQRRAGHKNYDRRRKLIHAIARIGGEPAVPPLLEALAIKDQRPAVYEGMRIVGGPAILAALFMLRTASGPRIAVAMNLLDRMRADAAPHLVSLLNSTNRSTRDLATDVLTRIATPEVRPQIIRMVREKKFADLRDGVRILATLYNSDVRNLLFELLEHKNPQVRLFVVNQLWNLRDPKTFRVLRVVAANDAARDVRIAAVRAVAGVTDPLGPALLQRMTAVPDSFVRREVVEQLSCVGDWRTAVPALAGLLADPNDVIFRTSLAGLRRMTFQGNLRRAGQWRAWLRAAKAQKPAPHAQIQPDETAFSAAGWRFAAQRVGDDGPTLLVVSGPPYRDATHLAPQVWQLASHYRVVVMRRAPGEYRGARASQRLWSTEVDAFAKAAGAGRYVLLTDAAGSAYALRHASARKAVRSVVIDGGWLPSKSALRVLPEQMHTAMGELGRADWQWAKRSQWRVAPPTRLRIALRGVLRGLLGVKSVGLKIQLQGVLASDALSGAVRQRIANNVAALAMARVKQPVLLLLGAKSPWAKTVPEQLKELPKKHGVRLVTIPRAGALPLLEQPAPTIDAIRDFIR